MKKYSTLPLWAFALLFLFATSCASDTETPAPVTHYQKIAEGTTAEASIKVELYSTGLLTTGYNPVYIALTDAAGKRIEHATVQLLPLMDMHHMKHAAPVENPTDAQAKEGYFPGAVVFTMPSGDMGSWSVRVKVQANGKESDVSLPLTIKEPTTSRLKSIVSQTDGTKYFVALLQPQKPKVGVNDMEVAVYRMNTMLDFPAVSTLQMVLEPEMPSMGHGSPNNVNPVHTGGGHYKGKVNFTMTGQWYVHLSLLESDGLEAGTLYFELTF